MAKQLVIKFGGSSVGSPEGLNECRKIIRAHKENDQLRAAICSAFKGVTSQLDRVAEAAFNGQTSDVDVTVSELIQQHHDVIYFMLEGAAEKRSIVEFDLSMSACKEALLSPDENWLKFRDLITSFGERWSSRIIAEILKSEGLNVQYVDSREIIKTDNRYGFAQVMSKLTYELICEKLSDPMCTYVVTGFIASCFYDDTTTTLGRNGSDFSASILARALNVEELEIWTDVNGILTSNPQLINHVKPISEMTQDETMIMGSRGAKVIFKDAIKPLQHSNIVLKIKNTFAPFSGETIIYPYRRGGRFSLKALSIVQNVTLFIDELSGPLHKAAYLEKVIPPDLNCYHIGLINHQLYTVVMTDQKAEMRSIIERELAGTLVGECSEHNGCGLMVFIGEGIADQQKLMLEINKKIDLNHGKIIHHFLDDWSNNYNVLIDNNSLLPIAQKIHDDLFGK